MKTNRIADVNLLDFGHTLQIAGVVYSGGGKHYLTFFPEDKLEDGDLEVLEVDAEGWDKIIRQTDLLETEMLEQCSDGSLMKVVVRKSTRQIEQGVSWRVYKRDGYACRYCAANDVPLTVDHVVCWESMGPSTEDNLVAACRKCNKMRGNTPYEAWLEHPFYKKVSQRLDMWVRQDNIDLVATLPNIQLRTRQRAR